MFSTVLLHPVQNRAIVLKSIRRFFERVGVEFEKGEQVFIETHSLVVVTVEQSLPMQPRFIDQAGQMHVAAEFLVGTTRTRFAHGRDLKWRAEAAPRRRGEPIHVRARSPTFPAAINRPERDRPGPWRTYPRKT